MMGEMVREWKGEGEGQENIFKGNSGPNLGIRKLPPHRSLKKEKNGGGGG